MTPIDEIFASSSGVALILAMQLDCDAWAEPIRICDQTVDFVLGLETGEAALFENSGVEYALPKVNSTGQQTLAFAIDNVRGIAQQRLDEANEQESRVTVTLRIYAADNLEEPAQKPYRFTVMSTAMSELKVQIEAGFHNMLSRRWPPNFITADLFPGVTYIT